jgi:hypothetical protein
MFVFGRSKPQSKPFKYGFMGKMVKKNNFLLKQGIGQWIMAGAKDNLKLNKED